MNWRKKAEQMKAEKRLEQEQKALEAQESMHFMEIYGKDLEDLAKKFSGKLTEQTQFNPYGNFDARA